MKILLTALVFWSSLSGATEVPSQSVILLTLDGVRVNEVHSKLGRRLLPELHRWSAAEGFSFGSRARPMRVSNRVAMSLPGYRAILSGRFESSCSNNDCSRISVPTLFDRVPGAVFASWDRLSRAIRSDDAATDGSIALRGFHSPSASPELRQEMTSLLTRASTDLPPWRNSRWDRYTWEMANAYLAETEPPVTYLSFLDSDEWGHDRRKPRYLASIRDFDQRLQRLRAQLATEPGRLERTSFVITTDHGRGRGYFWRWHGRLVPHSRKIWAFVIPSESLRDRYVIRPAPRRTYEQSQIRSTVEALLSPETPVWEHEGRKGPLIRMSPRPEAIRLSQAPDS